MILWIMIALAPFLIILWGSSKVALAVNQQGQPCISGAVAPIVNSNVTDGNNLVCVGGTWQYPAYSLQSYSGSAGASCSGYPTGALHYNTTIGNVEYCNGTIWNFLAAGPATCSAPSGLSFTTTTGQSLGVLVYSAPATITFTGCSTQLSVTMTGEPTSQISINSGTWSPAGSISSGQTLQVRMTTSGSASTSLAATITVGSNGTTWTTTTKAGALKMFATANAYNGNLGGLTGADAKCNTEAATLGYSGTYKAILSDSTTSAASRLTLSYPIVRASDGATVSIANLWNGALSNYVFSNANSWPYFAWTGTYTDGTKTGTNCTNWTSSSSGVSGNMGWYQAANFSWIAAIQYGALQTHTCDNTHPFYCLQQ